MVIAAAGGDPAGKWGNYLGGPKHVAPVDGKPLLARTIGQARTITGDVHLTCPDDLRYALAGATRHIRGADYPSEYAATRDVWNEHGPTVLLLGDVYFTTAAINTIRRHVGAGYRVFGRYGPSKVTGTPYGEIFAVGWLPDEHPRLDRLLGLVHRTRAEGTITRPPGWMLLRAMQGTPMGRHRVIRPPFVDVDDLTDDVDRPEDYMRHPAMGGGRG